MLINAALKPSEFIASHVDDVVGSLGFFDVCVTSNKRLDHFQKNCLFFVVYIYIEFVEEVAI